MEYERWFSDRLTKLRMERGISAREMSMSLGQSESYINKIENRRTMPSLRGFFSICEYLEIEPGDFFDVQLLAPDRAKKLHALLASLTPEQTQHIIQIIEDLCLANQKSSQSSNNVHP